MKTKTISTLSGMLALAMLAQGAGLSAPMSTARACVRRQAADDLPTQSPASCVDGPRSDDQQEAGFGFGFGINGPHKKSSGPPTFTGARLESFSATKYLSTAAGGGPDLGPSTTMVALIYVASIAGAGDQEIWNNVDNADSGGWELNIHNGNVVQVIYLGAGAGLANTTHQVLTVGYHVIVFWQDGAGTCHYCLDGATPETNAAPTYHAAPGGAIQHIGLGTDGGSFPWSSGGVVRLVRLSRAPVSDAEAQSWGTMGQDNALALPSSLTADPSVTFDWYAPRDWDGVSGTSTSGGSSPVTFTVTGAPVKTAITEQANVVKNANFQNTTSLDTVRTIGGLSRAACFATYQFTTSDTIIGLEMISTEFSLYPTYAALVVYYDTGGGKVYFGQYFALIQAQRCTQWVAGLPGGAKTITVVMGSQSTPDNGATVQGTQLRSVHTSTGGYTDVAPSVPTTQIVMYGHSIPSGGNVVIAGRDAYPCLMRTDSGGGVTVEAWGSRRAWDDSVGDITGGGGGVSTTTGAGVLIEITTKANHGLATGAKVDITGITGNTAANSTTTPWTITVTAANKFTLNGSTGNGAYVSGGYIFTVVDKLVVAAQNSSGSKTIVFDIGTNDYFITASGSQSSTNFGLQIGAMLDCIHARDATIVVIVTSPQKRYAPAVETERVGGWGNLDAYRAAEKTAVSTRTAYAKYYNGSIVDGYVAADVDAGDGVHPVESGHVKRATAFEYIIYKPMFNTGLFALWDPATASVTSGHVTSINDSSGSGDANRNATASGTPPYTANDAEGDVLPAPPTWTANTSGDWLDTGTFSAALTQPCTIVHVGRSSQVTAYESYYDNNTAGAGQLGYYASNTGAASGDLYSGATGDHRFAAVESTLCLMAEVWDGASGAFFVADMKNAVASAQNTGVLTFTKMRLGSDNGNTDRQKGKNGVIAAFTGHLSAANLAKVGAYLAIHAGVPYSY